MLRSRGAGAFVVAAVDIEATARDGGVPFCTPAVHVPRTALRRHSVRARSEAATTCCLKDAQGVESTTVVPPLRGHGYHRPVLSAQGLRRKSMMLRRRSLRTLRLPPVDEPMKAHRSKRSGKPSSPSRLGPGRALIGMSSRVGAHARGCASTGPTTALMTASPPSPMARTWMCW